MKSNHKKLGKYIQEVNIKNKELGIDKLLGVSITKKFIPSIANTIGTDMSKYKIVRKNQFAYGPVTSRNGEKISVALLQEEDCIISTSYTSFEIIDANELLPEYLMMWFRRPEFDRYARYMSHGSVREMFSWDEMCDVELPVPSPEKQRKIVREYNIIVDRIKLNEQLNKKLEESAQAIYKHWFVDFEFPISSEYATSIGKAELEGKPYKSNGGEMIYCEDLDQYIPMEWNTISLDEVLISNPENLSKKDKLDKILYLDTGSITNNKIGSFKEMFLGKDTIPSRAKRKVVHNDIIYSTVRPNLRHYGILKNPDPSVIVSTGFCVLRVKDTSLPSELVYMWITSDKITEYLHSKAEMSVSTYPSIKPEDLLEIKIPFPSDDVFISINRIFTSSFQTVDRNNQEVGLLKKFSIVIHQKMTKASV